MSNPPAINPLEIALRHHRLGRFKEAEPLYRQMLAAQPNHPDALQLLGILYGQTGRKPAGIELLGRACAMCPNVAIPWIHLGSLLRDTGQSERAIAALSRAIQIDPTSADAHNNLGNALIDQRKWAPAAEVYRIAARLEPRNDRAYSNLGVALRELGQHKQAIAAFSKAIEINPASAIAHNNLGLSLRDDGQLDAAIVAHRRAVQLDPRFGNAFNNLSVVLRTAGQRDEALAASNNAVTLDPASAGAHSNRGLVLADLARLDEAIAAYRKSLELQPTFYEAWTNLGIALGEIGRFAEALTACQRAVDLNPNDPGLHFNLGLILLAMGDFARGWVEYEWRWKVPGLYMPRPFTQPRWDGRPLNGKTILLHADQGYGDTIQFIRYVRLIAQGGGRILLGCDKPLKRLFEGYPHVAYVFSDNENVPHFDVHCPVTSLGAVCGATEATIPTETPYIHAAAPISEYWKQKLAPFAGQLKVGLAWAGRPTHRNDRNRSLTLSQLAPVATAGVTFFSLQKGPAGLSAANPPAAGMQLIDFTSELSDFADTAGLIAHLDLVICVDTAVAHLSAAMGKPTWVLIPSNPDWRWLIDREDSPWYATMRLFRQRKMGHWEETIERMAGALRELTLSRVGNAAAPSESSS